MSGTNGHANGNGKSKMQVQIEVFRIDLGAIHQVRMLSPAIGGLMTHYYKGKSRYCLGKECNPIAHREGSTFKGYVAAQVWMPAQPNQKAFWKPVVLEVTAALELDLRPHYARGQIWELFRLPVDKKENPPVQGVLLEEHDPATFAPDFEIRNVLKNLYQVLAIDLSTKNPMPPKTFAEPDESPPPAKFQVDEAAAAAGVDAERLLYERKKAAEQRAKLDRLHSK